MKKLLIIILLTFSTIFGFSQNYYQHSPIFVYHQPTIYYGFNYYSYAYTRYYLFNVGIFEVYYIPQCYSYYQYYGNYYTNYYNNYHYYQYYGNFYTNYYGYYKPNYWYLHKQYNKPNNKPTTPTYYGHRNTTVKNQNPPVTKQRKPNNYKPTTYTRPATANRQQYNTQNNENISRKSATIYKPNTFTEQKPRNNGGGTRNSYVEQNRRR